MSDAPPVPADPTPNPTDPPAPAPTDPPAPAPAAPAPAADPAPAPAENGAELQSLRDQLAQAQVKASERAKDAAKQATDELTKKLGLALGYVEDEAAKAPDVDALTRQAAADAAAAKSARIEAAVVRLAPTANADVDALLDSTTFTKALDKLDPAAEDFRDKVGELIKSTVAANPKYAAAPIIPGRSGGNPNAGNNEPTGQLTREQLARMSPAERLKAHQEGRCKTLLGG